jgi:hypothetical protein
MTIPEMFLTALVLVALWAVADALWRLLQRRPARYLSVFGEIFGASLLVVVATALEGWSPRDLIAKGVIVISLATATVLRLIARKQFAVQS